MLILNSSSKLTGGRSSAATGTMSDAAESKAGSPLGKSTLMHHQLAKMPMRPLVEIHEFLICINWHVRNFVTGIYESFPMPRVDA